MYANNRPYYGMADLMGWRNMRDARVGFEFLVTKKLKIQGDFNKFCLATSRDGFYNAAGTRTAFNQSATSRHIGSAIDIQGSFQVTKTWMVGAGFGRLLPGAYTRTLPG